MPIDGSYKAELETTMGPQEMEITLETDGHTLRGTLDGAFGSQTFNGGTVKGNDIAVSLKAQSPLGEVRLDVTATVNGNEISGQVQLGSFRPSAFKGSRT